MKIISVVTFKGGAAKTTTAVNFGHILATEHGHRVLIVDNDAEANATVFFKKTGAELSIADVLGGEASIHDAIVPTGFDRLDLLPADGGLHIFNREVLKEEETAQHSMLANALAEVADDYDYVIIDNAPGLTVSVINALVASHEVIIPVKIDQFNFKGVASILQNIESARKRLNPSIRVAGCLVTMYERNNITRQGVEYLRSLKAIHTFDTVIRKSVAVTETSYEGKPLLAYKKRNNATQDYLAFTQEYLSK